MSISVNDLIGIAKFGGGGLALALLLVFGALLKEWLWIGTSVNHLLALKDALMTEKDLRLKEKDDRIRALEEAVDARQVLLDRTLEMATVLKTFIPSPGRQRG